MRPYYLLIVGLLLFPVLAVGQVPDHAVLHIVHADSAATTIAVRLDGSTVTETLARYRAAQSSLTAGTTHTVTVHAQDSGETLTQPLLVYPKARERYWIVFMPPSTAESSTTSSSQLILVGPAEKPTDKGKSEATFVLASRLVGKVDVFSGWFKILSEVQAGAAKGPTAVAPGSYKLVAKNDKGEEVLGPLELTPEAGKSYLIVAYDLPTSATPTLAYRVFEGSAEPKGN